MRKATKAARAQLGLFPTTTRIPQLPREINPRLIVLLARLLRQHVERESVAKPPETGHE